MVHFKRKNQLKRTVFNQKRPKITQLHQLSRKGRKKPFKDVNNSFKRFKKRKWVKIAHFNQKSMEMKPFQSSEHELQQELSFQKLQKALNLKFVL